MPCAGGSACGIAGWYRRSRSGRWCERASVGGTRYDGGNFGARGPARRGRPGVVDASIGAGGQGAGMSSPATVRRFRAQETSLACPVRNDTPKFDRLARVYRWMEWLSFGPYLSRCRRAFLPQLRDARRALVLGDGDGRFTAALLRRN